MSSDEVMREQCKDVMLVRQRVLGERRVAAGRDGESRVCGPERDRKENFGRIIAKNTTELLCRKDKYIILIYN